jgi:transcriptional regulator with XRE-family HTH domain
MGHSRPRPKHLAAKLLKIRSDLRISQAAMLKRLGLGRPYHYTFISKYELNKNEPPLMVLLAYSKVAGVSVETLIDDRIDPSEM